MQTFHFYVAPVIASPCTHGNLYPYRLWGSNNRDFGFEDNKYRYNRGHWKWFDEDPNTGKVQEYTINGEGNFEGRYDENFATDFIVNRGIEFIDSAVSKDQPFALVLSIPDPHGKFYDHTSLS